MDSGGNHKQNSLCPSLKARIKIREAFAMLMAPFGDGEIMRGVLFQVIHLLKVLPHPKK